MFLYILFFSLVVSADCDVNLRPTPSVLNLLKSGVQREYISLHDVEVSLAQDLKINPFRQHVVTSAVLPFAMSYQKQIERMGHANKMSLIESVNSWVAQARGAAARDEEAREVAREETRRVLAPRRFRRLNMLRTSRVGQWPFQMAWHEGRRLFMNIVEDKKALKDLALDPFQDDQDDRAFLVDTKRIHKHRPGQFVPMRDHSLVYNAGSGFCVNVATRAIGPCPWPKLKGLRDDIWVVPEFDIIVALRFTEKGRGDVVTLDFSASEPNWRMLIRDVSLQAADIDPLHVEIFEGKPIVSYVGSRGEVYLADAKSGLAYDTRKLQIHSNSNVPPHPHLYREGSRLLALYAEYQIDGAALVLWNVNDGQVYGGVNAKALTQYPIKQMGVVPSGRGPLAYLSQNAQLRLVNLRDRRLDYSGAHDIHSNVRTIRFNDQTYLVWVTTRGELALFDVEAKYASRMDLDLGDVDQLETFEWDGDWYAFVAPGGEDFRHLRRQPPQVVRLTRALD